MLSLNLFFSKFFSFQKKFSEQLLNKDILKNIKYPNTRVMILDDDFDFCLVNDIANNLNIKIKAFKLENDEALRSFVINNADLKGNVNSDIIFYQIKTKDIKYYSNIIKPNYILINKLEDIIDLDENREIFEESQIIFNKNYNKFIGNNYSIDDKDADYYLNNIDFIKEKIEINNKYTINIEKTDNNYLEHLLMMFSFFTSIFNIDKIVQAFNEINEKKFTYKNKTIFIDINEMNYNSAIKFVSRYNDYKVLVIGWRTNYEDISWLYNIEIERLINKNIQKIYCIGVNAYDIAARFKYSDFNEKNIVVSPNIDLILNELKSYNLNLYVLTDKYYINTLKEGKNK